MNELKRIVANTFEIPLDSIVDTDSNRTLPQWDSLGHINLITALEQHFGLSFTIDEIVEMSDLPTIQRLLQSKTK